MRVALIVILAVCLVGCGRAQSVAAGMRLTSTALAADGRIDARQSAYGQNLSPPLAWTGVAGAKAYAIILEDPDAAGPRPFVHWLIWNIPGAVTALPQGLPMSGALRDPGGAVQGANDAGGIGYFGPRPPSGVHHYRFRIFALGAPLALAAGADRGALGRAMNGHVLAMGELAGTFAAPGGR
jgi:Raf kinase inhibitor-like YbhB/YbcL family protein